MKFFLINAKMQGHWIWERPWAGLWLPAPPWTFEFHHTSKGKMSTARI